MKSWYAARRRFKDVKDVEVGAQLCKMWAEVVKKVQKEMANYGSYGDAGADERYSQMVKELETKMAKKIGELTD
jgi:cell fate (sporulation/competence/biofilm development) regulator YmcA (YheA/YmcA/DUF963 family)